MPRPSLNIILFLPHDAIAIRRSKACAVSVEPLGREIRSANGDVPGVSFSVSGY